MREHKTPITDVPSLNEAISEAKSEFSGQVWWRGQRDYAWPLQPSLFRTQKEYDERSGVLRFQQRAVSRHRDVPLASDRSNWLFLMQHYRLPTRLLDWTESPLIAAFFACEIDECHLRYPASIPDPDGALFALSPYKLNENQAGKLGLLMPEDEETTAAIAPAFDEDAEQVDKVIAVRPAEVDVRLMVQISEFTLNGHDVALEALDHSDDFLIKFRIAQQSKLQLREELKFLGIRLSSIFPDLEHLAEEIRDIAFKKPDAQKGSSGSDEATTAMKPTIRITRRGRGVESSSG